MPKKRAVDAEDAKLPFPAKKRISRQTTQSKSLGKVPLPETLENATSVPDAPCDLMHASPASIVEEIPSLTPLTKEFQSLLATIQEKDNAWIQSQLIKFDLSARYGPCIGLTRLERFERAVKLNLDPPGMVRALLIEPGRNAALWKGILY